MHSNFIDIVETAYAPEPDDAAWLGKVARATRTAFDLGEGVLATFVDAGDRKLRDPVLLGCSDAHHRFAVEAAARMGEHEVASLYRRNQTLTTARENIGVRPGEALPTRVRQLAEECGFVDAALLLVADPTGFGFFLGAPFRHAWAPSRRQRSRWSRVAAHLAAGYRLQRNASKLTTPASASADEAILDPDGKIQHAAGPAREEKFQSCLRRAARSMIRARTKLRRDDPDEALAVWEGLVAGRWSLVDRFESDGRHYLVARKNDPEVSCSTALTQREQQVLSYVALGHASKFIAYELGISESSVSEAISDACAKLGVRSRVELIQFWRAGAGVGAGARRA